MSLSLFQINKRIQKIEEKEEEIEKIIDNFEYFLDKNKDLLPKRIYELHYERLLKCKEYLDGYKKFSNEEMKEEMDKLMEKAIDNFINDDSEIDSETEDDVEDVDSSKNKSTNKDEDEDEDNSDPMERLNEGYELQETSLNFLSPIINGILDKQNMLLKSELKEISENKSLSEETVLSMIDKLEKAKMDDDREDADDGVDLSTTFKKIENGRYEVQINHLIDMFLSAKINSFSIVTDAGHSLIDVIASLDIFMDSLRNRNAFKKVETKKENEAIENDDNNDISTIKINSISPNNPNSNDNTNVNVEKKINKEQKSLINKCYQVLNIIQCNVDETLIALLQKTPLSELNRLEKMIMKNWLEEATSNLAGTPNGKKILKVIIERSINSKIIWNTVISKKLETIEMDKVLNGMNEILDKMNKNFIPGFSQIQTNDSSINAILDSFEESNKKFMELYLKINKMI